MSPCIIPTTDKQIASEITCVCLLWEGNCFLIRKIWVNLEMYLIFPSHFIPCKEYKNDTKI